MAGKHDKVKDCDRSSIIMPNDIKKCFFCGSTENIHIHEVFGGPNRDKSKQDKMCVYLCATHHNMGPYCVHNNKDLDNKLKQQAERIWIDKYTNEEDSIDDKIDKFIKRYGKNYLERKGFYGK